MLIHLQKDSFETPLTKRCPRCNEAKSANAFYKDKSKPNGLSTYCKSCSKIKERTRYEEEKPLILDNHKKAYAALSTEKKAAKQQKCREYGKKQRLKNGYELRKKATDYREKNRLQDRENKRKYREKNRKLLRENAKVYNNSDHGKERKKAFHEKNPTYQKEYSTKHYEENTTTYSLNAQKNYQKNKPKRLKDAGDYRRTHRKETNATKAARKAAIRADEKLLSKKEKKDIAAFYAQAGKIDYEIDHIIPIIPKKKIGRHCLSNLQVIPAKLNLKKHVKIDKFTNHPLGICCIPYFEGITEEHLRKLLGKDAEFYDFSFSLPTHQVKPT